MLFFLLPKKTKTFIAYSENGRSGAWNIPDAEFTKADISEITADGNVFSDKAEIKDNTIYHDIKPGQALVIKASPE